MPAREYSGVRDLAYSAWHRADRISRFLGRRRAALLSVIDIDWCEYCNVGSCREPLALIETARDQSGNRAVKPATVTGKLATKAGDARRECRQRQPACSLEVATNREVRST